MPPTAEQIKDSIGPAARDLVTSFRNSPYSFLYESDLQATFFALLRNTVKDHLQIPGTGEPMDCYEVAIINTEYKKRFDIACINPETAHSKETHVDRGCDVHIYDLPVLVAIELKYCKMGDQFGWEACWNDFKKLTDQNIENKVVLGFVQDDRDAENFFKGISFTVEQIELDDVMCSIAFTYSAQREHGVWLSAEALYSRALHTETSESSCQVG